MGTPRTSGPTLAEVGAAIWLVFMATTHAARLQGPPGEDVHTLLANGRYVEAEARAAQNARATADAHGEDSAEALGSSIELVVALVENGRLDDRTVLLAQRAATLAATLKDQRLVTASARALGDLFVQRGEADRGLSHLDRAVQAARGSGDQQRLALADALESLAVAHVSLQAYDDARRAAQEAITIRRDATVSLPDLARALWVLALVERHAGNYAAAEQAGGEAGALLRASLPDEHPGQRPAIQLSGDLSYFRGEIAQASIEWTAALRIAERTLRPGHPALAIAHRLVAIAAKALGNIPVAEDHLNRATAIAQQSLPTCHPEVSDITNDLAVVRADTGDFAAALEAFGRALATAERCLSRNHQRTATVVYNLAGLRERMGDLSEAERLRRRALQMWVIGLGSDHPYVARGLDALADVVSARGRQPEAQRLVERALEMRRRRLGLAHPDVAWTLTNLARILEATGNRRAALNAIDQAIAIYEGSSGAEPADLVRSQALQGTFQIQMGRHEAAVATLGRVWQARRELHGDAHPLTAASRVALAQAKLAAGDAGAAFAGALQGERDSQQHLRHTVRYLPNAPSLTYAASRARGLDLALSMLTAGESTEVETALDALVGARGIVLEEFAARARMSRDTRSAASAAAQTLISARQRLATLVVRSASGETVPRSLIDEAQHARDVAELSVAAESSGSAAAPSAAGVELGKVISELPPTAALISFVRYDRTTVAASVSGRTLRSAPAYLAFVVRGRDRAVHVVPVGSAAQVDTEVLRWREEARGTMLAAATSVIDAERAYRAAGGRLRRRVWDSVAVHLDGVSQAFIVPDGTLNLVNFAALPVGHSQYLVESGPTLHYLSAERDLLPGPRTEGSTGLLALGGAAFGPLAASSTGQSTLRFGSLPGTVAEARNVAALWSGGAVEVLTGRAATSSALADRAAGKRVVHIATHGFFLDAPVPAALGRLRGVGGLATLRPRRPVTDENPLLLAGLAFAGANRAARVRPGDDDGILTAEEVAGLNLQGVEWAVLSACDTGLGRVAPGEGVLGLRRAFQVAGARTVIMSLWSVDDSATGQWMKALYEARLVQRLSTLESVRQASLSVLKERRQRRLSTHPFYWAAFVAAGDWR